MPLIHLLNKATSPIQPEEIPPGSGIWESGLWLVSTARAGSLKGHPIHFHRRKADTTFLSGIVIDYRRELYVSPQGRTSLRTIFIFKRFPDPPDHPGFTAVFTDPED